MRGGLPGRVAIATMVILAVAVSLTGVLNYYQFRSFATEVLRDRLVLILEDIQRSAQTSLGLSFPLDSLPGVNRAINANLLRDERILSIEFFDDRGQIVYGSDESLLGDLVSVEWMIEWDVSDGAIWSLNEPDARVVGVGVRDSLGRDVGSLALRYSRAAFDDALREMAVRIAIICGIALVAFALLGALLCYLLTRGPRDDLKRMQEALRDDYAKQMPVDAPPAARFAAIAAEARRAISSAEAEIRQLEIETDFRGSRSPAEK